MILRSRSFAAAFAAACTFLLPALAAGAEDSPASRTAQVASAEVHVLQSDDRALVVEYRPRYYAPRSVGTGAQTATLFDFEGSIADRAISPSGSPDLRYRSLPVGLPGLAGNQVHVIASDYEDIPSTVCAPVPVFETVEGMLAPSSYERDPAAYSRPGYQPAELASLASLGQVRTSLLGELHVYPVQFNASSRTVRRYTRIVVELVYGSSQSASRTAAVGARDFNVSDMLLNSATASRWSAPRTMRAPINSVLQSGTWYRIAVNADGIYKLDAATLSAAGIPIGSVTPGTIRIFGNGGIEVQENVFAPRAEDLTENAIYVQSASPTQFGGNDYLLFYGRGTRGWSYDSLGRTIRHYIHHYTEVNYYWLTWGGQPGKRMAEQPSLTGTPAVVADRFTDGVFVEEEKVNLVASGKEWYGQEISTGSSFTHVLQLPGLIPNTPLLYRFSLASHSGAGGRFDVRDNGTVIGSYPLGRSAGDQYGVAGSFQTVRTVALPSGNSQLNFAYVSSSSEAIGWIDWLEVLYPRFLWGVGEYLRFRSPESAGLVEYRLQQFGAKPMVFNVTDPANVRLITGVVGSYTFLAAEDSGKVSEYCAAGAASWKVPAGIQRMDNQDLHGSLSAGADFIIVTSPEFRAAADRLKAYRENPAHGNLRTVVVDVNQIYNEFSGGLPDVTAIRDFLKYAYDTWTKAPTFVLFFGGASYDFKGLLGARTSFVPTWQSDESLNDVIAVSTDDFFVEFGGNNRVWLTSGRISSRNAAEADIVLDKIMRYESRSVHDNWKMRVVYVGDDAYTSERGEVGDLTEHSDDAERLANGTPNEIEKKKIYIVQYPTAYTAQGRRKPAAYEAIINQINEGVLILNYAGHGNPTQLAHENVFNVSTSIPRLVNSDRLAVFLLATCNFSQFDDPARETGSELLMNKPDGGAVGVISASRKVFGSQNAFLAENTYRNLFSRDAFGRLVVERPAVALAMFKRAFSNTDNDQKFFYMGDPTMRLQYPQGYASIDSINGESVVDAGGLPRATAFALKSLSQVSVSGTIRNAANAVDPGFNGRMTLVVNDATQMDTVFNFYPNAPPWAFRESGGQIYRGENSVVNGRFRSSFIVPKDISYSDSTTRGRLVAYYYSDATDGAGYTGNVRVAGADSAAIQDSKGPTIALYLDNRSFRPGDLVSENPILYVDLTDSSGINTSSSGLGHRIEAWVNNSTKSTDVTGAYTSHLDNFREGTVQFQLKDLAAGKNTLRVRAWDSFNNSSMAETFFDVASSDHLTVSDIFNYPNPFSSETAFTFRQNQTVPLDVVIKIYTVAGRQVQTIQHVASGESFVRIPWDGRDRDGDILANGVYLYKLVVRTVDGRFSSEAIGKLAVLK